MGSYSYRERMRRLMRDLSTEELLDEIRDGLPGQGEDADLAMDVLEERVRRLHDEGEGPHA